MVYDMEKTTEIKSKAAINCVKISKYYYNVLGYKSIFASSNNNICILDFEHKSLRKRLEGHRKRVYCINFSQFDGGQYLCSASEDCTVRLWDIEKVRILHVFEGHGHSVMCVDISPLQSHKAKDGINNNIGGSGYSICSGSLDGTIRIWDIEKTKESTVFKEHESGVLSIQYGSNELGDIGCANTILSGSTDKTIRLWDIREKKEINRFDGHTNRVLCVQYSPFVSANSNVICSGSSDGTVRFWDIRSRKQLNLFQRNDHAAVDVTSLKFMSLQTQINNKQMSDGDSSIHLCYGSSEGKIYIRGY
ncbi:hypothetical protein RFI_25452 [Reticulomyxa filosa]|uniref:Uncharacterized protein n=1 Tax=Reticulomyxa filosa TaxID=46433 RepID=X6MD49_RETFI|nr:hypothetical protein RFI_25452 [Reticulomyxa filosa]|eukprot:ETO11923.1 hypothetical protein RFI_25452 [Reticulomyxa filosa]